jgi:opacity protein-like surface antigen
MPNQSPKTLCLAISLGIGFAASPLYAEDPATKFSVEAGPALGQANMPGGDADLLGFAAGVKWELGEVLISHLTLCADYIHLESEDAVPFQRDKLDVDARFGFTLGGFLNPYVSAGLSAAQNEAPAYTPEDDWKPGYGLGAGVGITILPKLLHTTPSVRYAEFEDLRTMTYTLDTEVHFSLLGVGLRLDYEDNLSRDGDIITGVLYASLRF